MRVLVVLQSADESSIPLEVATRCGAAFDLRICSFEPPASNTFDADVYSLDGSTRLDPRPYRRLAALIAESDIVHVHPNAVGAIARVLARYHDCALITTEHNTHDSYGRTKSLLVGITNTLNDVIVPVSSAVAESMSRWSQWVNEYAGVETRVIHNGVDIEAIEAAQDEPLPVSIPEGTIITTGGRLVKQKNIETVIQTVAELFEARHNVHLLITGDGPRRHQLEALTRDLDISNRVHFCGFLPQRRQVHRLYHASDLFVLPSRHEGFGVAVAEAMATGLPVVVSDLPVFREVCGDPGIYIDPADPSAIAGAIEPLLDDPNRRDKIGRQASERIREHFSLEATAQAYRSLYRDLDPS